MLLINNSRQKRRIELKPLPFQKMEIDRVSMSNELLGWLQMQLRKNLLFEQLPLLISALEFIQQNLKETR